MNLGRVLGTATRVASSVFPKQCAGRAYSGMTRSPARGAFIVFEGVDRAGKSTQCELLSQHLNMQGVSWLAQGGPQ